MPWLTTWVRELVVIVFFVTVAYMLLPDNSLRRYARLVIGLVVIVALLAPMMDVIDFDPSTIGAYSSGGPAATEQLIADGQQAAAAAHRRITGDGRSRGEAHVASVAELALGAVPEHVDVHWLPDGSIAYIIITARDDGDRWADPERIARLLAGYFGLRFDQVVVRYRAVPGVGDGESGRQQSW